MRNPDEKNESKKVIELHGSHYSKVYRVVRQGAIEKLSQGKFEPNEVQTELREE